MFYASIGPDAAASSSRSIVSLLSIYIEVTRPLPFTHFYVGPLRTTTQPTGVFAPSGLVHLSLLTLA